MGKRLRRLFTIKTRFEAFLVIYAIAVGAAERAQHYLHSYGTGAAGIMLALCCSGVVFVAGAKLLDAVKRDQADARRIMPGAAPRLVARHGQRPGAVRMGPGSSPVRRHRAVRNTHRG